MPAPVPPDAPVILGYSDAAIAEAARVVAAGGIVAVRRFREVAAPRAGSTRGRPVPAG